MRTSIRLDGPIRRAVALETTLLVHGVPTDAALDLHDELEEIIRAEGALPALVGVLDGTPTAGLSRDDLARMLDSDTPKLNTANLGPAIHRKRTGATTVSTTLEIAHAAGLRVFATGGLGGVHKNFANKLDISADLLALTRFPLAVVCSGVKSLLDVISTREALETLGICVAGYRTDRFPAFYLTESDATVDARFETTEELAVFLNDELDRASSAVVVANPIPGAHALDPDEFNGWLAHAERTANPTGRDTTPVILAELHKRSGGATLRANIELVKANAALAAGIAAAYPV